MAPSPLAISHAACKGHAPENTLAGIRAALDLGCDGIEIDVHCTRDGVPILLHDDTVDRTTDGSGDVRAMTLAEVRRLDAGARQSDGRFRGEPVPTLAETLALTRGRALLVIEIKQSGIAEAVAGIVREARAVDDVMVWSFLPDAVAAMRAIAPEIPACQLWPGRRNDPAALIATALANNAQGIVPEHVLVDEALVGRALRRGLRLYTWTPDEPDRIAALVRLGVDGICSNYPERVIAARTTVR